jgi:hypothetical protein
VQSTQERRLAGSDRAQMTPETPCREGARIVAQYISPSTAVVVPSITDPDIASVATTVTMDFACALGDFVVACPLEALPTNCKFQNAYVTAANTVTLVFGSEGGNVTGASKNFRFYFHDLS